MTRCRITPLLSYGSDTGSVPMDALMKIVEWMLLSHIQSLCNVGICSRWLEGRARNYPPHPRHSSRWLTGCTEILMLIIVFYYFLPCVTVTESTLCSHPTKTLVVRPRHTGSEISTSLTAEIHIIWMIPHLVANLTDIASLCIYHQGSSGGRSFGFIQNNLIPIVFLPHDIIFMG